VIREIKKEEFERILSLPRGKVVITPGRDRASVYPDSAAVLYEKTANMRFVSIKDFPRYLSGVLREEVPQKNQYSDILYKAAGNVIGEGSYFAGYRDKPELFAHLGKVIREMLSEDVDLNILEKLQNAEKWEEIIRLTSEVKRIYKKRGFIAPDEVYRKALEEAKRKKDEFYFVEDGVYTSGQKRLIDGLSCRNECRRIDSSFLSCGNEGFKSYLLGKRQKPEDDFVGLEAFAHPDDEVKGVFDIICSGGSGALKAVGIANYCGSIHRYRAEAERRGINITCGRGLPLGGFAPVRLFLSFMKLLENEMRTAPAREALSSLSLNIPKGLDREGCREVITLYKRNRGLNDFSVFLKEQRNELKVAPEGLGFLAEFFGELSESFERVRKGNREGKFISAPLLYIIERYISPADEGDAEALSVLKGLLEDLEGDNFFLNSPLSLPEKITERVSGAMTPGKEPDGKSCYLSTPERVLGGVFETVCFSGFDQNSYSARVPVDPVFLMSERDRYNRLTGKNSVAGRSVLEKRKRKEFMGLTAAAAKKVIFSWTANDPLTGKGVMPSPFLFEIYRAVSGRAGGLKDIEDYAGLDRDIPGGYGFYSGYIKKGPGSASRALAVFNNLDRHEMVRSDRSERDISDFSGRVDSCGIKKDFDERVFSPSKISRIISCPAQYFFENVLKLEAGEYPRHDPFAWFDHLEWGTLIHGIFSEFYRGVRDRSIPETRESLIKTGVESLACHNRFRPAPGKQVYKSTENRLKKILSHYYTAGIKFRDGFTPSYFEAGIGKVDGETDPELRVEKPPVIGFGSLRISLRGIIDRIDSDGRGNFILIDYKTGKNKVNDREPHISRSYVQHVLYPVIFKKACGSMFGIKNLESAYYFCTFKGDFQKEEYSSKELKRQQELYHNLLTILLGMVRSGSFPQNRKACRFCDYRHVCPGKDLEKPAGKTAQYLNILRDE